jgi:hypothetical protein
MFVVEFPGVTTFNSNAGAPDTVPEVVTELPFTGMPIVTLLSMPGVISAGVRGFWTSCFDGDNDITIWVSAHYSCWQAYSLRRGVTSYIVVRCACKTARIVEQRVRRY